jgi:ABC-type branched-subunit amino acid transport system substrate-binding protein
MLLDKLRDIDLIGVTFWENGFKHFTGNRPLRRPEDFAGLKIRTMKSRMLMEQFRALGAQPISIDFHATRQALADGVVDGQENPLVAIVSMGLHEVQPHLTLSNHGYLGYVFMVSARVFETLPPDIRRLVVETARELTPWEREETRRGEQALLATIRQAGVTIHELSEPERRRFAAATAHIPAMFEDVIGADLLSRTEALLDAKATASDGIVIGLDADLSMDGRVAGLAIKRGAQLAIDEINAAGGVLGKPLHLLARDHKAMPSQGIHNQQLFAVQPNVVAVLGGVHGAVVVPELDIIQDAGMPYLIPWAAGAAIVENGRSPNWVFRISLNDRLVAPFMIDRIRQRYHKPAVLAENSVWGRDCVETMRQRLSELGLSPALVETFNRGETDFSPQLTRAILGGADILVMIANAYEGESIIRAVSGLAKPPPVVSHWGITAGDFWHNNQATRTKVDLSFLQTFIFPGNSRPAAQALERRYQARYAPDTKRPIVAQQGVAQAYDLVQLLALAIRQAGSTDRRAVRTALEHLPPYEGAVRRYAPAFTPDRHDALDLGDYHIARFSDDGTVMLVEP